MDSPSIFANCNLATLHSLTDEVERSQLSPTLQTQESVGHAQREHQKPL